MSVHGKTLFYLEHADFPERDFPNERVLLGLHELFDSHQLGGLSVAALVDGPVGALADLAKLLILLHKVR